MTDETTSLSTYTLTFDKAGVLSVNGTPFPQIAANPDDALDWALEQVARAHDAMPEGSSLRVEIIDEERPGHRGAIGVEIPWGERLTGDIAREHMAPTITDTADAASTATHDTPSPSPSPVVEDEDEGQGESAREPRSGVTPPLWPEARPAGSVTPQGKPVRPWGSKREFAWQPKEPLPQPVTDEGRKKPTGWGISPKWVALAVALVIAFVGYSIFKPKPDESKIYAKVCVNNISFQRLADEQCAKQSDTNRWWWVQPKKHIPAVGDYVAESTGSFTAPADKEATVDTGIPVDGR